MNASTTTQNTGTPIMPVFITACSAAAVWAAKIKQRLSALSCGEKTCTCFPCSAWLRSRKWGYLTSIACPTAIYARVLPVAKMVQTSVWSNNLKKTKKQVLSMQKLKSITLKAKSMKNKTTVTIKTGWTDSKTNLGLWRFHIQISLFPVSSHFRHFRS